MIEPYLTEPNDVFTATSKSNDSGNGVVTYILKRTYC